MTKKPITRAMRRARRYARLRNQRKFWPAWIEYGPIRDSARDLLGSGLVRLNIWTDGRWSGFGAPIEAVDFEILDPDPSFECDVDLKLIASQQKAFDDALPEWARGVGKLRARATLGPVDKDFLFLRPVAIAKPTNISLSLSEENIHALAAAFRGKAPE